ncbi:peptide ABC transporter substrate-binding protein [Devosia epidermidihirudinis]|uniref:Peptide ABC transporter substrate-binding protein n=1 Tax=Devosia epidermidihirudinis TaxID=1293439 RepID=A0A0F5QDM3_9HYPH|nr:ABC transporter substrate-binding protein [Devosia epidermidihirudinis]KKC38104.1 peptide ABC transporter substrate-binding protein [Devosia epidermidihirudinis]
MIRTFRNAFTRRAVLLGGVVVAMGVAGLTQVNAQDTTRLVIGTTADVVNFNPLVGNSRSDVWVTNLMYPRLMQMTAAGSKDPYVATDWGYSEDGKSAWLEIRNDLTWSDDTPFTADDIVFTITAIVTEKIGVTAGLVPAFVSAKAVSPTRVEFELSRPDSAFLSNIGFWMPIVPKHAFPEIGSVASFANDSNWVSAGPFQLTTVEVGQRYVLEASDNYPLVEAGRATIDEVEFRVFPDVNAQALALRAGDLDVIANALPAPIARTLQGQPGITVEKAPSLGWSHVLYNMKREQLANVLVRRALAHSVDYAAIRAIAMQGLAETTNSSVISPVLSYWADPTITEYTFDPAKAKELLTEAGYVDANGDGFFDDLDLSLLYEQSAADVANWAQIMKDSAAQSGIKISLVGLERNTYLARGREKDFDIYAGNWAVMEEPAAYLGLAYRTDGFINYASISDPQLEAYIDEAQAATTPEAVKVPVQAAAKLIHDQVYDNVLYYQTFQFAFNSDRWEGLVMQPSDLLSLVNPLSLASVKPKD